MRTQHSLKRCLTFPIALLVVAAVALPLAPTPAVANGGPAAVQAQSFVLNPRVVCSVATGCWTPSAGNHAVMVATWQQTFSQVDHVDITMTFAKSNPVDPGESVSLGAGEGFSNIGTTPITVRIITLDVRYQPTDVGLFVGHTDVALPLWMGSGSAKLSKVTISITGVTG